MKIKIKIIKNLDYIINETDLYGVDEIEFVACCGNNYVDGWCPVHCKEELGADCVREQANAFIAILPGNITDSNILKILKKLNTFEKKVKSPLSKIYRVKGWQYNEYTDKSKMVICKHMLYVKYATRWHRNSAAHAVYTTHFRKYLLDVCKFYESNKDEKQLKEAKWIIDKLKKHGISIFGNIQHEGYDVGMVSLMKNLEIGKGCLRPDLDDIEKPPQPERSDFKIEDDYYMALLDWEQDIEDTEDDYYDLYGDLDERIPEHHGYGKIEKLYTKDFVKKQKVQRIIK